MPDASVFKVVYITVQTQGAKTFAKVADSLGEELGIKFDVYPVSSTDIDNDLLKFQELCRYTRIADFVFIRYMTNIDRFSMFRKYEPVLTECGVNVMAFTKDPEFNLKQRYLFRGTDEQFEEIRRYAINKGQENDRALLWLIAKIQGATDRDPPEPVPQLANGIYHPKYPDGIRRDEYVSRLDRTKPTVGIFFVSIYWQYGNLAHIDALVESIEKAGMNAIPVFFVSHGRSDEGVIALDDVLRKYYTDNGKPIVDAVIISYSLSYMASDQNWRTDEKKSLLRNITNVPVFEAVIVSGNYADFEHNKIGLDKKDLPLFVDYPELDGYIDAFPIGYVPKDAGGRVSPIPERIDHMTEFVKRWATLRSKPPAERKVAILIYQNNANSGDIGAAMGLDSIESMAAILKRMKSEGYTVEKTPENSKEMMSLILDNVTNDTDSMSVQTIRRLAADMVPTRKYRKLFDSIPEFDRQNMLENWGEPPGTLSVDGDDIIIPGIVNGNVYIGYQPLRGTVEKMAEDYHNPVLFAQHQYLEFYHWLKDDFKADMIIHLGTHGSLEWLPGQNVAMSKTCDCDVVLDGVPNLYPYIIDDPGEGIQAKRRSQSVLIGHMPPALARADTSKEMDEVYVYLQDYYKTRSAGDQNRLETITEELYEVAKSNGYLNDLNLTGDNDPGPQGFGPYVVPLHDYLNELKDALVRADLHVFGRIPNEDHLMEMLYSITRLDNGEIKSLRDLIGECKGYSVDDLLDNPSDVDGDGRTYSEILDGIDRLCMTSLELCRDCGYDAAKAVKGVESAVGSLSPELEKTVTYVCESLVPNLRKIGEEMDHLMDGLDGQYVLPGPSGAPTRGGADILPTGRNYYGLDPGTLPSRSAYEVGKKMADQTIEKYIAEKGSFPRQIGFIVWATDIMKTGGDEIGYILWLMGVKPTWSLTGGLVTGLEVIPLSELGRPRVDVTVNITGLFRDVYPNLIDIIDDAVKIVSSLDESDEDNALAANLRKDIVEGLAEGLTPDEARRRNSVRVFGAPAGAYGTGVGALIDSSAWKTTADIADVYETWSSYGYSKGNYSEPLKAEFARNFRRVKVTVKNMPDRGTDIVDCDDIYSYLGGMNAYVRAYGDPDAISVIGDSSNPKRTAARSAKEELRYVYRSKVLNPKFIKGMMEHGYRGAANMANIAEFTLGWAATSDAAEDWMYDSLMDKYLLDEEIHEWMKDVNPYAVKNMIERLEESIERGLWNASDEYKEKLKDLYLEMEERLEELTDR